MSSLKVFSTFTGVGSPEMALRNIGCDFEVVGISEVDRYAIVAYDTIHNNKDFVPEVDKKEMLSIMRGCNIAYNFSTYNDEMPRNVEDIRNLYEAHIRSKNYGDIRSINPSKLPNFDLFTYSFPCKNISIAGSQAGFKENSETQSSLLWECEKIISIKRPKFLLMENVKNLVGANHIADFQKWIDKLKALGYNSYWKVLNGVDYNTPQNRERVIMVSILKEFDRGFIFPEKKRLTTSLKDLLERNVDKKYFIKESKYSHIIEDLPSQDTAYCLDAHYYKGISVDNYIEKRKRQLIQVGLLENKDHCNSRVYSSHGVSPTLNSMNGGNRQPKLLERAKVRRMTPLECWRIMNYTDEDFYKAKKAGLSNSKLYERAGRGIIVNVLEEVFKNMAGLGYINSKIKNTIKEFCIQEELF